MAAIDDFHLVESNNPAEIHAQFDRLRSKCPVAHTSENGGFWVLSRYEDVKACTTDSSLFISSVKAVIPSDPRGIRRPPLNTDPPAHTPYRTALDRTLKPARIHRLEPLLRKHAEREFQAVLQKGEVVDICSEFAGNFCAWTEVTWLNLNDDMAPRLADAASKWINAWREQDGPETSAQSEHIYDIARSLFRDRQINPRDPEEDPASSLLIEKDAEGNPLSDELLVGCLRQSLVVGMVAPPILIGSMCKHLSEDKALQKRLRNDQSQIPAAVEEFVRLYVPYRGFCRTPSQPVVIHGRAIGVNEPISMTYAAANRDPAIFDNPHEFIMGRPNIASHVGFGKGRHRCAGMPLAKMALQIALRVILQNTSNFDVVGPFTYAKMPEMGITSCPLRLFPPDSV